MAEILDEEKVWLDKSKYADAEHVYYEKQSEILKCESLRDKSAKVTSANINNCKDCFMYDIMTQIYLHNDVSKLLDNVQQWDEEIDSKINLNQYKQINKFECIVCSFKTIQYNDWKCHIMSVTHIAESHRIKNLYSYICFNKKCKLLFYGSKESLNEHNMDKHLDSCGASVCKVSTLMAEVMKRFLAADDQLPLFYCSHCNKFEKEPIHTDDILSNTGIKVPIEYYCRFCKVQFLSNQEMIDYHFLSVEHLTIKCFDKLCSKAKMNSTQIKLSEEFKQNNEKNLSFKTNSVNIPNIILTKTPTMTNKKKKKNKVSIENVQSTKPNLTKDVALSQKYDDIKSEHLENLLQNESLTDFCYVGIKLLDNIQQVQNPFVNNNLLGELNDDLQDPNNKSNENVKLTPNHCKHHQEYTNFFNNKINLLKKLRQYKDLIIKTLSYYCDGCDFITVEKYVWYIHNKTTHPIDINRSTVYCSTCAMFICGDDQEHDRTIEHVSLLNFLPSLNPVKVLNETNSYEKCVESCSDEKCINLEKKEKTDLINTDCFIGIKYLNDNNSKTSSTMKEPSTNGEDKIIKKTILLLDKADSKYEHKHDDLNASNAEKLIQSEITSTSNSLPNALMTNPYQGHVHIEKIPENFNCNDLSTDDLLDNAVENDSTLIKPQNKMISNLDETTCSLNSSLTNKAHIFENIKVGELDEDKLYGEYVVQRLNNIKDLTVKQHVQLEIDNIFYINMKLFLSQEIQNTDSIQRNTF